MGDKYEKLVAEAPIGVFQTRPNGEILEINRAFSGMLGYDSPEEMMRRVEGEVQRIYAFQEDREAKLLAVLRAHGRVENCETVFIRKDGSHLAVSMNAWASYLPDDSIDTIVGFVSDVHELKEECRLRIESEALHKALLDNSNDALIFFKDGLVVRANRGAEIIFRAERGGLIGRTSLELNAEVQPDGHSVKEMIPQSRVRAIAGETLRFENRHRRLDGEVFDTETTLSAVHTEEGPIVQVIIRDISEKLRAEKKLRESESLLRTQFENSPDILIIIGEDRNILSMNRTLPFHPPASELEGLPYWRYLPPETVESIRERIDRCFEHGRSEEFEIPFEKDVHILARIQPIFEAEKITRVLVIATDITEMRKTYDELTEKERLLRQIADHISDMVMITDMALGITYASPSFEVVTGFRPEDLLGKNILEFMHPDDRDRVHTTVKIALASSTSERDQLRIRTKDGSYTWIEAVGKTIFDEDGQPMGGVFSSRDITARHMLEEELRVSGEWFRSVVENVNDIIYTLTPDGNFQYVSKHWNEALGHEISDVVGHSFLPFVHPEDQPTCLGILEQVLRTGKKAGPVEYRVRHANGEWRWHSSKIGLIIGQNGQPLAVGIASDITDQRAAERVLRRQRANLSALVENTLDLVWSIDRDYRLITVNSAFRRAFRVIHGGNVESGMSILDALPESLRDTWQERYDQALAGRSVTTENTYDIDGREVILDTAINPIRTDDGEIVGVTCFSRDATRRKKAEIKLAEREQWLQAILSTIQAGVLVLDPAKRLIIDTNEAFCRLTGKTKDEIVNHSCQEGFCHLSGATCPARVSPKGFSNIEQVFYNAKGEQKHVLRSMSPVSSKEGLVFIECIVDITTHKQAEEALRKSQESLAQAQALAKLGSWELELPHGKMSISNETYRIFGVDPSDYLPSLDNFLRRAFGNARETIEKIIEEGSVHKRSGMEDLKVSREDGREIHVQVQYRPVLDPEGNAVRLVGTVQDITERKRVEEEQRQMEARLQESQRLESMGILAGGVAHDFNNLLTGIIGNLSIAKIDIPERSPISETIDDIEQAALQAADLSKQMLAYSGKGHFIMNPLSLSDVVDGMRKLLKTTIPHNVTVTYDLRPGLMEVEADSGQMKQVLLNLATNAAESHQQQDGNIHIRTGVSEYRKADLEGVFCGEDLPEGLYTYLEVQDSGIGMTEAEVGKIFDPFYSTKFTGRGLGLAAVFGIVRGHRGGIAVTSAPGEGTSVRVLLPTIRKKWSSRTRERLQAVKSKNGVVLVADDEVIVRKMARKALERFGYEVVTANDGREALDRFREREDDLTAIVLDLTMPNMGGEEALVEIRSHNKKIPILLASGYSGTTLSERLQSKGATGFLEKPFNPMDLIKQLKEM